MHSEAKSEIGCVIIILLFPFSPQFGLANSIAQMNSPLLHDNYQRRRVGVNTCLSETPEANLQIFSNCCMVQHNTLRKKHYALYSCLSFQIPVIG